MTQEEKRAIRLHSSMSPFTLYIDDVTKLEVMKKLKYLGIDTAKGSIAATIRVLLSHFVENNDAQFDEMMTRRIKEEYLFTTKKNKRSTM